MMKMYSDIVAVPPTDVWDGRIREGEITFLAGPGGIGKGMLTADLAARVTRGDGMPGDPPESAGLPGSVIMISPEDLPFYTVSRLAAAGADTSMIADLTYPERERAIPGLARSTFTIGYTRAAGGDDLPELRKKISELARAGMPCRLVIIDPLAAVAGCPISGNQVARDRIISPLQDVARSSGAGIVMIGHTTKAGVIGGSQGLVDAFRLVLTVEPDPVNPDIKVLKVHKTNVSRPDAIVPVRYQITGDGPDARVSYLALDEAPGQDAASAALAPGQEPAAGTQARVLLDVLRAHLVAGHGPVSGQQLVDETALSYGNLRMYATRLERAGLICRPRRGAFEAVPPPAPAAPPAASYPYGSLPWAS